MVVIRRLQSVVLLIVQPDGYLLVNVLTDNCSDGQNKLWDKCYRPEKKYEENKYDKYSRCEAIDASLMVNSKSKLLHLVCL